jgi:hypothetical protein
LFYGVEGDGFYEKVRGLGYARDCPQIR